MQVFCFLNSFYRYKNPSYASFASYAYTPSNSTKTSPKPTQPTGSINHPAHNFMAKIRKQSKPNTSASTPTLLKRGLMAQRVTWDGNPTTFDQYEWKVKSHYYQSGCGYMFNEHFQHTYQLQGANCYYHLRRLRYAPASWQGAVEGGWVRPRVI